MEFGLLGPLVVDTGGSRLTITAGKQRALLAALLLRAGQVVPSAELAWAVWDGCPPESARVTLQNYVKRLRQALGQAGRERIVTFPAGYLIKVRAGELDVATFGELARAGRAAAAAGDWEQASQRLGAAAALWRGRPLTDVPSAVLTAQVPRLAGMRLDALEARIDADLHLGRHSEVVAELRSLVAAEPLRERLAELLMLALYRSGQQADALAAYRQARRHLTREVGIEPGPGLRELHQRVLRSDPALRLAPPAASSGRASLARLCLLPAGVAGFTGRSRELEALSAAVSGPEKGAAADGAPVVITAIGGTAGVGKTALAVHWARQHADRFPDGQLYVNLRGFGPAEPVAPAEALRGFLDALQVPADQVPAGLDGRQAMYRGLLAGRRMLVVLDNARDPDQVRPLLPGTPASLVLVTSRSDLACLAVADGARQVSLDVLTADEARRMLAARLGAARVDAEPQAAGELIESCARLPLALAITAARAAAHPGFPLAALAAELRDARTRLDVLTTGEDVSDVRAVFARSYRDLSPAAALMFRLLGVHPGPDITAHAAASLAGTTLAEAARVLRELTRGRLLTEPVPGRYGFHDLLRAYAAEQAAAAGTEADRSEALHRALDHYLHTAHAAGLLLHPSNALAALAPARPGVTAQLFASHQQARDWFQAERHVLLAAITLAAAAGSGRHAWQLPWVMFSHLDRSGQWHEAAAIQRTALDGAARLGDRAGQAASGRLLAVACARLGDYDQARARLSDCLGQYRELGDRTGEARARKSLGWVCSLQGRYDDALGHNEQAFALFRAISDGPGQASALNAIGWDHARLGDYQRARAVGRQALGLYHEIGDRYGEAQTWDSLGYAEHLLGRFTEAAACYQQAMSRWPDIGDRVDEAVTLIRLGDTSLAAGDPGAARDAWRRALAILGDLDHPDAADVRAKIQRLEAASLA